MSVSERKRLSSFLFERTDVEVLDLKFLRGDDENLTEGELCAAANAVLANFFADPRPSQLPSGRRPQRSVAEIFANA